MRVVQRHRDLKWQKCANRKYEKKKNEKVKEIKQSDCDKQAFLLDFKNV